MNVPHRVHNLKIVVNGITFNRIVIGTHYEEKHKASMNDGIILGLVKNLNGRNFLPEAISESGFKYFVNDPWSFDGKWYRLIWLIPPDESYLGVRNAFRRKNGNKKNKLAQ